MASNQTEDDDLASPAVFPPQRVLAPVDGSDNALRALRAAIIISKAYAAQLFIITVTKRDKLDEAFEFPGYQSSTVQQYNNEMDRRSDRLLSDALDLAKNEGLADVQTEAIPEFNSVPKQILENSVDKKIDLIVMGTRGIGGFKRLMMGSVSSTVVANAQCNVMVVR